MRNSVMAVCIGETERQRTAMVDTTWTQTYLDAHFFLLFWRELWYRAGSQPGSLLTPPPSWHVYLLTALRMIECLTLWLGSKTFCIMYFRDVHTFFLLTQFPWFICAGRFFTKMHILFWNACLSKVNMLHIDLWLPTMGQINLYENFETIYPRTKRWLNIITNV